MQADVSNHSFLTARSIADFCAKGPREQAIDSGDLLDITEAALKAGFTVPVGITRQAWHAMVVWTTDDSRRQIPQDMSSRLRNIVWTLRSHSLAKRDKPTRELVFYVYSVPCDQQSRWPCATPLKAMIQPGDFGEAVITLMMPDEG